MGAPAVVVIAAESDVTADLVVLRLTARAARVVRFDTAAFPLRMRVAAAHQGVPGTWGGRISDGGRTVGLQEVRAVYYRRPGPPVVSKDLPEPYRTFAAEQAAGTVLDLLTCLPVAWLNNPLVDMPAAHKPRQIAVAAACGMHVPATLITNDPEEARVFAAGLGGTVVCKPLTGSWLRHGDGRRNFVPAHLVRAAEIDGSVSHTAHQFQEWVDKAFDARVTVVGRRVFTAAIHGTTAQARTDWRSDYEHLDYEVVEAPETVAKAIHIYMERYGITFGAFDFSVDRDGRWVFLECNPSGQWSWIEHRTGLPIADAHADYLLGAVS